MKKLLFAAVCILPAMSCFACEICGCSGSGAQFFGILPWYHSHFVGVRYQNKSFTSHHLAMFPGEKAPVTTEQFSTIEVWGRYNINKRWQAYGFVPYAINQQKEDGQTREVAALGDASIMLAYQPVNITDANKVWKQVLQVAAGVKMPTGSFNRAVSGDAVNINMQPGSGSWDVPLNVNYTLRYKKIGISTDANYTINTPNAEGFQFGDRLNTAIKVFRWIDIKKESAILPQVGMQYEHAGRDFDGEEINPYSGGSMISCTLGANAYVGRFGFELQWQKPLSQNVAAGQIKAHDRMRAQVSYRL